MKTLFFASFIYAISIFGEYAIVFVHIGNNIPSHTEVALSQARLFNPNARIILLGSTRGLNRFCSLHTPENIELCSYEDLPLSTIHREYQNRCLETSPFWRYTSERFLYLWDLLASQNLENVFHLENDNMLYADLEPLLPLFQKEYPGVGATFDNEDRCIPGFVWIANCTAMEDLAKYFAKKAPEQISDMYVMGLYRKEKSTPSIDSLPIIMPSYSTVYPLESPHNHKTERPQDYSKNADTFHAIFDAAAIGQFLGGIDPIHANNQPGFINESCLFNPSILKYEWIADDQGRLVPHAFFQGTPYRIINLHIHSKRLHLFKS